jgi:hypothetical protein
LSKVIGLTGYAGAGKSTVAKYLEERHGFTRISFAAPLKTMLWTLDPILGTDVMGKNVRLSDLVLWPEDTIKGSAFGPEYRRLMQVLGTDCVRREQDDFWTRAAARRTDDPDANYVFDDCRFPNEAQFILDRNPAGLWNIARPGCEAVNGHISEQYAGHMGEVLTIGNGDGIELLHAKIDGALTADSRVTAG